MQHAAAPLPAIGAVTPSSLILALDLASRFGYAEGRPGGRPISGSERFAAPAASQGAVLARCLRWTADRLSVSKPDVIYVEVPGFYSIGEGKSSIEVIELLIGLWGVVRATAYLRGVYDVRKASASEVRKFVLGTSRMKGKDAKPAVWEWCVAAGFIEKGEPRDYDRSDAVALWQYGCEQVCPGSAKDSMPLWIAGRAMPQARARG